MDWLASHWLDVVLLAVSAWLAGQVLVLRERARLLEWKTGSRLAHYRYGDLEALRATGIEPPLPSAERQTVP